MTFQNSGIEDSTFEPPLHPETLDDAVIHIRSAAWQYQIPPADVWRFFKAGFVAAQVLGTFSAMNSCATSGGECE